MHAQKHEKIFVKKQSFFLFLTFQCSLVIASIPLQSLSPSVHEVLQILTESLSAQYNPMVDLVDTSHAVTL